MALSVADQEDIWKPAIAATRLMVLTGWLRGEVLGLRWSEIDLPRRTARLVDTKTGVSLRVLSEAGCAVIGRVRSLANLLQTVVFARPTD